MKFTNQKKCPKCLKLKNINEFKPRAGGSISYCYPCQIKYYKEYNAKRYGTNEQKEKERLRGRERYHKSKKRYRKGLKAMLLFIFGGRCAKCGYRANIAALDFHHRQKENKKRTLSQIIALGKNGVADAYTEASKCEILCSNCHREETYPDWTFGHVTLPEYEKMLHTVPDSKQKLLRCLNEMLEEIYSEESCRSLPPPRKLSPEESPF